MNIFGIEFQYPLLLILLLLIPIIVFLEVKKTSKSIIFGPIELLNKIYGTNSLWWYFEIITRICIFVCFILLLANPGYSTIKKEENKKGIDIAIVLDISKSMLAEDISPNRIESAKKVIADFIGKIESDRISFTIFAGKPFVSIPLTFDYSNIIKYVKSLTTDSILQEIEGLSGTAIGDGLMLGADSLINNEKHEAREKVIILLTDGEANMGINPKYALKYIKDKKIKIYTIGIGKPGGTELYITDSNGNKEYFRDATGIPIKAKVDEELLTNLAITTGGEYYNAQSSDSLKAIFDDLSKLNKTKIETKTVKIFNSSYNNLLTILIILIVINLILINKYKYR